MAISLISPGIKITEQDVVASQQAVSTTVGAFAGQFQWGPVEDPTLVNSEVDLVSKFGKPTTNTAVDFLSAANFLAIHNNFMLLVLLIILRITQHLMVVLKSLKMILNI